MDKGKRKTIILNSLMNKLLQFELSTSLVSTQAFSLTSLGQKWTVYILRTKGGRERIDRRRKKGVLAIIGVAFHYVSGGKGDWSVLHFSLETEAANARH